MQTFEPTANRRRIAQIAGAGYLAIIVFGIFAEVIVRGSMVTPGDAAATAANIAAGQALFRSGIAAEVAMLTFDGIVAVALYLLLRPIGQGVALVTTVFRLLHTAIYGATLLTLLVALHLSIGDGGAAGIDGAPLDGLVAVFMDVHGAGYALALMFFAVSVGALAYAGLKHGAFPVVLSALLAFAAAGYLVDGFAQLLLSNYAEYETVLGVAVFGPAVIGELSLALWLLLRGGRAPRAERAARGTAMSATPAGS